jgi:hypothetical protein
MRHQNPPTPNPTNGGVDSNIKAIVPGHVRRMIGTIRRGAWGVAPEEGVIAQRQPGVASPKCESGIDVEYRSRGAVGPDPAAPSPYGGAASKGPTGGGSFSAGGGPSTAGSGVLW